MGDHSLDNDISKNTAIVPVAKLENDSYNWWDRHAEALRIKERINPEVVLIGNSITHFWGGQPKLVNTTGNRARQMGQNHGILYLQNTGYLISALVGTARKMRFGD
jgi:hypothetical protein